MTAATKAHWLKTPLIRWLSLPFAVLLSFYLVVMAAVGIFILAESVCPAELVISDMCTADYINWVKEGLLHIAPAIAAALTVYVASACAPNHKFKAAAATFVLGSCAAFYYAWESDYWLSFAITEAAAIFVLYRLRKNLHS